jgi:hypothetical protein
MFRNRLLIFLGGCFLAASAACAGDVGYVDCSNHPEDTQVFGKPRRTPDVLASIPCGERFTVLVYGFVFSQVMTKDGKVGYVYSNLIAVDRASTAVQQSGTVQFTSARTRVPASTATVAQPNPPAPAQPQPTVASSRPAPAPATTSNVPQPVAAVAQPNPPAPAQPQSSPAPAQVTASASPAAASPVAAAPVAMSNVAEPAATVAQPNPPTPAPAQPQPMMAQPAPAPAAATSAPEPVATVAQPAPATPAQPEPSPAEPAAPSIRPTGRGSWEKPNPSMRRRAPLLELYGGYSFARLVGSAGTSSNLNGGMGSIGWNIKPWLQIVGDSSYNLVTISGTKNVLYGNHFGPRYFHRSRNRWGITPFVEGLVGGSRVDTSVSGSSAYNTSTNCLSYKAGGGIDIHPSRHIDIRLFDVDYYRTAFGTNLHQNNYWASTGIVVRLFGGNSE